MIIRNTMKRLVIILAMFLGTVMGAKAQSFTVKLDGEVPEEAAAVLLQRVTQILEGGDFTVTEDAKDTVWVYPNVVEYMTTPGSISQSVLVLDVKAAFGEVEETFSVKGVGKNNQDAWLRACKQVLPRSRQAQEFIQKLKQ